MKGSIMSEKIRLNDEQTATLATALTVAAQALYHYADVSDTMGSPQTAVFLRNQAEDMEFLLAHASFVDRITVRVSDEAFGVPSLATRITF